MPLGGYVKMLGDDPEDEVPEADAGARVLAAAARDARRDRARRAADEL